MKQVQNYRKQQVKDLTNVKKCDRKE